MKSVRHAVLRVIRPDGKTEGTAFLAMPVGLVVTCYHVAETAANASVLHLQWRHPDDSNLVLDFEGKIDETQFSKTDCLDVALIHIPVGNLHPDMFPLRLADWSPISGTEVESYGFPESYPVFGLPASASYLEATNDKSRSQLYVFRSNELTGGFSGAPLVIPRTNVAIGVFDSTINPDRRNRFRDHAIALPARLISQVARLVDIAAHPLVEALRAAARLPSVARTDFGRSGIENLHVGLEPSFVIPNEDPSHAQDIFKIFSLARDRKCRLLLVTGTGGSGKTTLVKRLNADGHQLFASLFSTQSVVMFRITALQLSLAANGAHGCSDEEVLWAALRRSTLLQLPFPGSAKLLREIVEDKGTVPILLIDALDEVRGERYEIVDRIGSLISLVQQHGGITLLTSRPIRELDVLRQARDEVVNVLLGSVGTTEIERFSRSYLSILADRFLADVAKKSWVSEDATPLKIAISAASFRHSGRIADSEAELIEEYCDALVSQTLVVRMGWDKESFRHARELINQIAFEHIEFGDSPVRKFANIIVHKLPRREVVKPSRLEREISDDIIELQKCGVLLHGDADKLSFSHVTIRDCCAAQHLAALPEPHLKDSLAKWMDSNWRSTIVYSLASHALVDLSDDLLREAAGSPKEATEEDVLDFIVDCLACGVRVSQTWKGIIIEECLSRAARHEDGYFAQIQNKCLSYYVEVPDDILRIRRLSTAVELTEYLRACQHLPPSLVDFIESLHGIR